MDHKEEQNNEIEALDSIYCGEMESECIGYINLTSRNKKLIYLCYFVNITFVYEFKFYIND